METVRKAAERGDAEAEIALAKAYFNGNGAPKDDNQAFEWVRKAAEQKKGKKEAAANPEKVSLRSGSKQSCADRDEERAEQERI